MKVAFYAPLKSPNSAVPSGDRRVARALIQALELKGHKVEIASEFQTREAKGLPEAQEHLRVEGRKIADNLIVSYRALSGDKRPDVWFTYHLYYKAMDWIGPSVAEALSIPYVAAEVSYAPKRAGGPWDMSHQVLGDIIKNADAIFGLNSLDSACVTSVMVDQSRLVPIKPFMELPAQLDRGKARSNIISLYQLDPAQPILVTVAMMRDDAKLQSYEVLGQALKKLSGQKCQLLVVGDGPARKQVEASLGTANVHYLGELPEGDISPILAGSDLFVWPAVNEAYGMAMLEAQAMGLPVVAGRTGGVGDIIRDQETGLLCEVGNPLAFANTMARLIENPALREGMAQMALKLTRQEHSLKQAAETLDKTLMSLLS
jgi:glycosyltransferase involved in cell wall biosynthesis